VSANQLCLHVINEEGRINPSYKASKRAVEQLPQSKVGNFQRCDSSRFPLQVEAEKIERRLQYDRTVTDRNKRILNEYANMRTSLDDGTFVIVAESRSDMMRALIVGPEDTLYANGLFE
jgi:hypothetical protein